METEKEVNTAEEAFRKLVEDALKADGDTLTEQEWQGFSRVVEVTATAMKSYAQSQTQQLQAENLRLREALGRLFKYMDDGFLVRDISKDHLPGWGVSMLTFGIDMGNIQRLLNPKEES